MITEVYTAAFTGIDGVMISVEVDTTSGLPATNMVGLADTAVKESRDRVRSAIINSGFEFPVCRITINLAPADLRKDGSHYDLPIAIGILASTGQIDISNTASKFALMGELSLFGELKKIKGALPIAAACIKNNIDSCIVPIENAVECSIVQGLNVYPVRTLREAVECLVFSDKPAYKYTREKNLKNNEVPDFSDVLGQESSKRAIEIAASGGHNMLMFGPPGTGKSMLAKRIPGILPELSYEEALEVTKIYSISGLVGNNGLMRNRPFRSPHHTSTSISLVGGGTRLTPGEISLAHNGVLYLDEMLEFKSSVLEVLRQPLEDRNIKISRLSGSVVYPANIMLVASINPCPCGRLGSQSKVCECTDYQKNQYIKKISGPILERLDIFSFVGEISFKDIRQKKGTESSSKIRDRVVKSRDIQRERLKKYNIYCNAQMSEAHVKKYCILKKGAERIIESIYNKYHLSARVYTRILKVARTIADLEESEKVQESHIIESLNYRKFINQEII